jgi:sporulation protein YlmC with PRC-barrel domain
MTHLRLLFKKWDADFICGTFSEARHTGARAFARAERATINMGTTIAIFFFYRGLAQVARFGERRSGWLARNPSQGNLTREIIPGGHYMKKSKRHGNQRVAASAVALAGALSLGVVPVWAQQSGQSTQRQRSQMSQSRQSASSQGMISASDLRGHKVVDANNREVGTIENVFIDPQSGRMQRVDIDFSVGTKDTYSVGWDELKIKQQGRDLVIAVDESVVRRVEQAGRGNGNSRAQTQQQSNERNRQASGGVLGLGGNEKEQPISASQLSSSQIRKIQQELNKEGFDAGQVDGTWNSQTQSAITNFQKSKGLSATGQLDKQTIEKLGLDADDFRPESQSSSGSGSSGSSYQPNTR